MAGLFSDIAGDTSPRGLTVGMWMRRAVMALFALLSVLGLVGIFGQRSSGEAATSAAATLRLSAPSAVRGGLFFQSRIEVRALRAIDHPRLVLDRGWVEGMQVNSIEPSPMGETNRGERLVLSYDGLQAGDRLVVWLQFEVNPTNVGRRSYGLQLDDAETPIATLKRDITVWP